MFKHSTKVPRLYKISAKIAKDVKEGIGSIKSLVYENRKKHPNIKAMYALVTTVFQKHDEIENLLKKSQFFTKEPRADPWLTKILLVELLWGKKRIAGDSVPEKTVQAYEQIFKAHMTNNTPISLKESDTQGDVKPRYVRINTLFISLDDAVEGFRDEGWKLCKFFDKTDYKGFLDKISSLDEDEFLIDIHVPNLLIFPPKTEFYKHPAYKNGSIILQDKASCLPVHILNPPPGSVVLDMCAAPGMKTTQLAAVMNNQGTVYAVERNPKRFETLNTIIESSKATCIKTENKDVLTCTAADFKGVQYILVDPSCSGSGMTDRPSEKEMDKERIQKLAGFQIKILRSALTRYPDVKRVVYSTCSIFPEENEDVVRQVIETNTTFKLVPAKQFVNDTWQNVGSSDYGDIGKYCLYAKPNEDLTNGFFVAVFERLDKDEVNQFFNTKVYNYKRHVQNQENRRKRMQEANEQNYEDDDTNKTEIKTEYTSSIQIKDEYQNENYRFTQADETVIKKKKKRKHIETQNEQNVGQNFEDTEHKHDSNKTNIKEEYTDTIKIKNEYQSKNEEALLSQADVRDDNTIPKKKKKKKHTETLEEADNVKAESVKKNVETSEKELHDDVVVEVVKQKNKKKHRDISISGENNEKEKVETSENGTENVLQTSIKHKKKNRDKEISNKYLSSDLQETGEDSTNMYVIDEDGIEKKSKKKKRKHIENEATENIMENMLVIDENVTEKKSKKKKHKHTENESTEANMENIIEVVKHKKTKKDKKGFIGTELSSEFSKQEYSEGSSETKRNDTLNEYETLKETHIEVTVKNKKKKSRKLPLINGSDKASSEELLVEETDSIVKKRRKSKMLD